LDAYREKQLLERIAALEERLEKLENPQPWGNPYATTGGNYSTANWNYTNIYTHI
jgi:hypothetical protein